MNFFSQKWCYHPIPPRLQPPTHHTQTENPFHAILHSLSLSLSRVFFLVSLLAFQVACCWLTGEWVQGERKRIFFFFFEKRKKLSILQKTFWRKGGKKLSLFKTHTAVYRASMSFFVSFLEQFRSFFAFVFSFYFKIFQMEREFFSLLLIDSYLHFYVISLTSFILFFAA